MLDVLRGQAQGSLIAETGVEDAVGRRSGIASESGQGISLGPGHGEKPITVTADALRQMTDHGVNVNSRKSTASC